MNTLTKMAQGLIGHLKPAAATGVSDTVVQLPPPDKEGGMPLMRALAARASARSFDPAPLAPQMLSNLLWAGAGINREKLGGRTFPSAMNAQEVDVYLALPEGLYRYDAATHALHLRSATDVRRVTGYQDFVDTAPLDLVFVADFSRMRLVPVAQRATFAAAAAGAMAQNVYLFCASAGLATVIRAWLDRDALAAAMGLNNDQQVLLSQTVGQPKPI